jgi:hypothetical protein
LKVERHPTFCKLRTDQSISMENSSLRKVSKRRLLPEGDDC